jgi:hypothetical protein
MVSMQAFYTTLFSEKDKEGSLVGLLRIAQSTLTDILAVRSELAWDMWNEAK